MQKGDEKGGDKKCSYYEKPVFGLNIGGYKEGKKREEDFERKRESWGIRGGLNYGLNSRSYDYRGGMCICRTG